MIIHNISFDSVEWLSKNNKLIRVWRSDADYEPEGLEERWMSFTYPDWIEITKQTGELFECNHIKMAMKGFDVEVESVTDDFPAEILRRLSC